MRTRWIIACGTGDAAGIALVATAYAALDRGLVSGDGWWIMMAGAWEGLCLGGAQAVVLRRSIMPLRWIALTALGAATAYGLSLVGGAGGQSTGESEPPLALIVLLGAAMGLFMGAPMGVLQWLAARGILSARRWIAANMAGWALAMAVIMLGAASVENSFPLALIALAGAFSGAVAGVLLGLVTGLALPGEGRRAG